MSHVFYLLHFSLFLLFLLHLLYSSHWLYILICCFFNISMLSYLVPFSPLPFPTPPFLLLCPFSSSTPLFSSSFSCSSSCSSCYSSSS